MLKPSNIRERGLDGRSSARSSNPVEELPARRGNVGDGPLEHLFIYPRRLMVAADLSYELQRCVAQLPITGRELRTSKLLDVAAHLIPGFLLVQAPDCSMPINRRQSTQVTLPGHDSRHKGYRDPRWRESALQR